jgi:hypothetical protein
MAPPTKLQSAAIRAVVRVQGHDKPIEITKNGKTYYYIIHRVAIPVRGTSPNDIAFVAGVYRLFAKTTSDFLPEGTVLLIDARVANIIDPRSRTQTIALEKVDHHVFEGDVNDANYEDTIPFLGPARLNIVGTTIAPLRDTGTGTHESLISTSAYVSDALQSFHVLLVVVSILSNNHSSFTSRRMVLPDSPRWRKPPLLPTNSGVSITAVMCESDSMDHLFAEVTDLAYCAAPRVTINESAAPDEDTSPSRPVKRSRFGPTSFPSTPSPSKPSVAATKHLSSRSPLTPPLA